MSKEVSEKAGFQDRLLMPKEVAIMLKVSDQFIYKLVRIGDLRSVKIGRCVRIWEADVLRFIEQHTSQ